jgi:L-alanine-DL-glutamate epimerase-like enolase superfamily enzyme
MAVLQASGVDRSRGSSGLQKTKGVRPMKIMNIELFPIKMKPVKPDWQTNQATYVLGNATVIIRVTTDSGIEGLGEAATGPAYFNQTLGTLLDWLRSYAKALDGTSPLDIANAHRIMDRVSGEFPTGCQPARAGIDLALYDLIGKAQGRPVYDVLGGAYQCEFQMLTNLYELTPQAKGRAAREYANNGFGGLKVKVGTSTREKGVNVETLKWETAKLLAALESVPETVQIDADANQSWRSPKVVVTVLENILRTKFYPNLSIEQPLHHTDLAGHRFIREALNIPVILDEAIVSPQAMLQIVKQDAADRIVLKFNRVGGLFLAKKIATICEAAGIGISLDTMPFTKLGDTAACHLAATLRDPYPVDAEGHLWFEDTPFRGGLEIIAGTARIGSDPGFGVEIDEEKLKAMLI